MLLLLSLVLAAPWAGCHPVGPTKLTNRPSPPPPGACDVLAQDCGSDRTCEAYDSDGNDVLDATRCVAAQARGGAVGDPCSFSGESPSSGCKDDLVCLPGANGSGSCVPRCSGTTDAPECGAADAVCLQMHAGLLPACLTTCDPLSNTCPNGMGCYVMEPSAQVVVSHTEAVCLPEGGGVRGDPCVANEDCRNGLTCADADQLPGPPWCEGEGCCTEMCEVGSGGAVCTGSSVCESLDIDTPGLEGAGFCGNG